MTNRQFWLGLAGIGLLLVVLGPATYFGMVKYQTMQETQLKIEHEATERSEHRWDTADKMLQRLPFMKKDEDGQ